MSMNEKARAYFDLQQMIAELTAEAESIKDDMKAFMIENSTEELDGIGWRATWHTVSSSRFDSSAFKKEHAELYQSFCKTTTSPRFTLNTVRA